MPPTGYVGLFTWAAAAVTAGWRRLSSSLLLFLFLEVLSWMPRMLLSSILMYRTTREYRAYSMRNSTLLSTTPVALRFFRGGAGAAAL